MKLAIIANFLGVVLSELYSCRSEPYPKILGGDEDDTYITCISSPADDLESIIYFGGYSYDPSFVENANSNEEVPKGFIGSILENDYEFEGVYLVNIAEATRT